MYLFSFRAVALSLLLLTANIWAVPLKEVYDAAISQNGFDKWLELTPGETYTGGLLIGSVSAPYNSKLFGLAGKNVKINGNGAVLDLQGSEIAISFCPNRLEIVNCIIINGGVRFRGDVFAVPDGFIDLKPTGLIKFVTFYNAHDFAIRLVGAGEGITIERNLLVSSVDTGFDYAIYNGAANMNLPTGINCAFSVNAGSFGYPVLTENWSFHARSSYNSDPLYHFALL